MRLIDLDEFLRENCVSRETAELFPGEGQSSCDGCDLRTLEVSCERMLEFPTIDPAKWVPVSESLPEEHESIWAKAKGTDRWSESMWEKQSDEVIVTELFEDGTTRTGTACTHDGEWYVKAKIVKRKIVAWMPLPMPWKGEEG